MRVVEPLLDRIVVKRFEAKEETSEGGIIIPDSAKEQPCEGTVVAVGGGRITENGVTVPLTVNVGNHVLFSKYAGTEFTLDGEVRLLLREDDVLCRFFEEE